MLQNIERYRSNCSWGCIAAWNGYVAIADAFQCAVCIYHPDGATYTWSDMSSKELRSIHFLPHGALAISDMHNNRVVELSLRATIVRELSLIPFATETQRWRNAMAVSDTYVLIEKPFHDITNVFMVHDWDGVERYRFFKPTGGGIAPRLRINKSQFLLSNFFEDFVGVYMLPTGELVKKIPIRQPFDVVECLEDVFVVAHEPQQISLLVNGDILESVTLPDITYYMLTRDVDDTIYVKTSANIYKVRFWHLSTRLAFIRTCQ